MAGGVSDLEMDFEKAFMKTARLQKGRAPSAFLASLNTKSGLAATKALLKEPSMSAGFLALHESDRLDLSIEALAVKDPWRALFSPEEIATAEKRLRVLGY